MKGIVKKSIFVPFATNLAWLTAEFDMSVEDWLFTSGVHNEFFYMIAKIK